MSADTQNRTGEAVIEKLSKDMLLECYSTEDVAEDYNNLRERLNDKTISNRDFSTLLRLIWEFTVAKPKQEMGVDHTTRGNPLTAGLIMYPEGDVKIPTK